MRQNEYRHIREWLEKYTDVEYSMQQYYNEHHCLMHIPANSPTSDGVSSIDFMREYFERAASSPGLPTYGLFSIPQTVKCGNCEGMMIPEQYIINPSYDIGFSKHPRYCFAEKHLHSYYELEYVLEGSAHQTIWTGEEKHELFLHEGDFLLIPPKVSHEVYIKGDTLLLNLVIRRDACKKALLQNLPADSALTSFFLSTLYMENPLYLVLHTDNAPALQECFFDLLIENYGNGYYRRELANLKISILFLNLLSITDTSIDLYDKQMQNFEYIPAVVSYMETNYATITPQQVADVFHFSRAHLGRIYKHYTGCTLQDSICSIRIRHAKTLLKESSYSVQQIGEMIGYADTTNFIRRFFAQTGATPSQYRLICEAESE